MLLLENSLETVNPGETPVIVKIIKAMAQNQLRLTFYFEVACTVEVLVRFPRYESRLPCQEVQLLKNLEILQTFHLAFRGVGPWC